MTETQVAKALLEIQAVGFSVDRPVTFKSGIRSPIYVDNRRLIYWPRQWHIIIEGFKQRIAEAGISYEIIAGIETAGIPHSSVLAYTLDAPSVFVRKKAKEHGTQKLVEGGAVGGKQVLLIEDLITTGSSSLAGVEALRSEGAVVEHLLAIITYGFQESVSAFEKEAVRLYTLTTFEAILAEATKQKRFDSPALRIIEDWLDDPHGWAQRYGYNKEQ